MIENVLRLVFFFEGFGGDLVGVFDELSQQRFTSHHLRELHDGAKFFGKETALTEKGERVNGVDDDPVVVVDLGTGSGAIALSMAAEHDTAEVWATDASADALEVARANLTGVGSRVAPRVRLCEGWWFDALPGELRRRVHLVVSNPPYVADDEALPPEVGDWEPVGALFAGPTGLEAIELVLHQAGEWLADHGSVVLELAPHQSEPATALARAVGYAEVEVRPDLTGRDRVLVARA